MKLYLKRKEFQNFKLFKSIITGTPKETRVTLTGKEVKFLLFIVSGFSKISSVTFKHLKTPINQLVMRIFDV